MMIPELSNCIVTNTFVENQGSFYLPWDPGDYKVHHPVTIQLLSSHPGHGQAVVWNDFGSKVGRIAYIAWFIPLPILDTLQIIKDIPIYSKTMENHHAIKNGKPSISIRAMT